MHLVIRSYLIPLFNTVMILQTTSYSRLYKCMTIRMSPYKIHCPPNITPIKYYQIRNPLNSIPSISITLQTHDSKKKNFKLNARPFKIMTLKFTTLLMNCPFKIHDPFKFTTFARAYLIPLRNTVMTIQMTSYSRLYKCIAIRMCAPSNSIPFKHNLVYIYINSPPNTRLQKKNANLIHDPLNSRP